MKSKLDITKRQQLSELHGLFSTFIQCYNQVIIKLSNMQNY